MKLIGGGSPTGSAPVPRQVKRSTVLMVCLLVAAMMLTGTVASTMEPSADEPVLRQSSMTVVADSGALSGPGSAVTARVNSVLTWHSNPLDEEILQFLTIGPRVLQSMTRHALGVRLRILLMHF